MERDTDFASCFLYIYESLVFEEIDHNDHKCSPSQLAQNKRRTLAQLYYARNSGKTQEDERVCDSLSAKYLKQYFDVVDNRDCMKGLDTYLRDADLISTSHQSECENWNLEKLDCEEDYKQLDSQLAVLETEVDLSEFDKLIEYVDKFEADTQEPNHKPANINGRQVDQNAAGLKATVSIQGKTSVSSLPVERQANYQATNNTSAAKSYSSFQEKRPETMGRAHSGIFMERQSETMGRTNSGNFVENQSENMGRTNSGHVVEKRSENMGRTNSGNFVDKRSDNMGRTKSGNFSEKRSETVGRVHSFNSSKESVNVSDRTAEKNSRPGFEFCTAKEKLIVDQQKKNSGNCGASASLGNRPKSLGTRRGLNSCFVLPIKGGNEKAHPSVKPEDCDKLLGDPEKVLDERLKNIEPKMIELIQNEIMDHGPAVGWDDIAGLEFAKVTIKEIVVWPMLRPDIFTGLRGPPRGLLLFGPPGTGKTLIGKCIASQSNSTFFSISASCLTSKWIGEGEKMVRALFAVARVNQPSVIFIDEIDSLLSQRSETEHESSRRIKTEFLVQLDGATTSCEDRLLVVGATNRPQELDEAARRRLVKRLYIPLPDLPARKQIIQLLMSTQQNALTPLDIEDICQRTDGYSGADMTNLCRESALGPIRSIPMEDIHHITPEQVRPIIKADFDDALCQVRASVSTQDLAMYVDWNNRFGSGAKH